MCRAGLGLSAVLMAGLLASSIPSFALDPARAPSQHMHNLYESRDGLPQALTRAVTQTPDGYLWAGSDEGLIRFDGAHFTVFDRYNTPGLPTNLIHALTVDSSGGLWVGTQGRGLFHFLDGRCRSVAHPRRWPRLLVDDLEQRGVPSQPRAA